MCSINENSKIACVVVLKEFHYGENGAIWYVFHMANHYS